VEFNYNPLCVKVEPGPVFAFFSVFSLLTAWFYPSTFPLLSIELPPTMSSSYLSGGSRCEMTFSCKKILYFKDRTLTLPRTLAPAPVFPLSTTHAAVSRI